MFVVASLLLLRSIDVRSMFVRSMFVGLFDGHDGCLVAWSVALVVTETHFS